MNSKATSVHPTNMKYRAMGTDCRSCTLSNAGSPKTAMHRCSREIDSCTATPPRRCASVGQSNASTRENSPSPFPRRRRPGHAESRESNKRHSYRRLRLHESTMMSATSLPIAFKPCCDHSGYNMHPTAGLGLVAECEDLNPTAQTAHGIRRCPLQPMAWEPDCSWLRTCRARV
jgi:hypothetical protein